MDLKGTCISLTDKRCPVLSSQLTPAPYGYRESLCPCFPTLCTKLSRALGLFWHWTSQIGIFPRNQSCWSWQGPLASPRPALLGQGELERVAKEHLPLSFGCLCGWALSDPSGQPAQFWATLSGKTNAKAMDFDLMVYCVF